MHWSTQPFPSFSLLFFSFLSSIYWRPVQCPTTRYRFLLGDRRQQIVPCTTSVALMALSAFLRKEYSKKVAMFFAVFSKISGNFKAKLYKLIACFCLRLCAKWNLIVFNNGEVNNRLITWSFNDIRTFKKFEMKIYHYVVSLIKSYKYRRMSRKRQILQSLWSTSLQYLLQIISTNHKMLDNI